MSRRFVAFFAFALAGAAFMLPETASAAGGLRAGGGVRGPLIASPRPAFRSQPRFRSQAAYASQPIRPFRPSTAVPGTIAPSPHGYGTTSPLRPFANLTRRHHRIYHSGWVFPATSYGYGYGDQGGYIGTPYDPAEAIPVYGPPPAGSDFIDPPARSRAVPAAAARSANEAEDPNNACRAEKVTVPSKAGEREITVVRC